MHLGAFDDEEAAARKYDEAANTVITPGLHTLGLIMLLSKDADSFIYFLSLNTNVFTLPCPQVGRALNFPEEGQEKAVKGGRGGSSKFKGVRWDRNSRKWQSRIYLHGKERSLGYFENEEDAAKQYDIAAGNQ